MPCSGRAAAERLDRADTAPGRRQIPGLLADSGQLQKHPGVSARLLRRHPEVHPVRHQRHMPEGHQ